MPTGPEVRLVIDSRVLAQVTRGVNGPVFRRLVRDADVVKRRAQQEVGVYQPPDAYSAANRGRRPGTLRDSIVKRVRPGGRVPAVEVGTEDPIGLIHHEGTVPHVIRARNKPRLVFYWRKVGRVVAFPKVNHPGTRPNRFLVKGLQALSGRYRGGGLRTTQLGRGGTVPRHR